MTLSHRTLGRSSSLDDHAAQCWVFDVDGCLVDSLTGTSLRPGARELLKGLYERGIRVLLWSAGGGDYARQRVTQFDLEAFVDGSFAKNHRDGSGFWSITHLGLEPTQAVFVDDRPEDLSPHLSVRQVSPYLAADLHDHALLELARRLGLS